MRERLSIELPRRGAIVVVDPDPGMRVLLVSWLRDGRYHAEGAASFESARRTLARRKPDLLITEVRLGEFNGLHLIVSTRDMRPTLAAIVTTAVHDTAIQREATTLEAGYLVKPITRERLLAAVAGAFTPRATRHP